MDGRPRGERAIEADDQAVDVEERQAEEEDVRRLPRPGGEEPGDLAAAGLGGEGLSRFAALAAAAAAGALDPDLLAAAGADLQRVRNDPAERFRDDR